jgi:hypothetical protein
MPIVRHRSLLPLGAALIALGLAGCGSTIASTSAFKGESHTVAQAIADLQSDLSGDEQKKVCTKDLSAAVVASLRSAAPQSSSATAGCEAAIKRQLGEIDNLELAVDSVTVSASGTTAEAKVRSIYEGKTRLSILTLVKEGGRWKLSRSALVPIKSATAK